MFVFAYSAGQSAWSRALTLVVHASSKAAACAASASFTFGHDTARISRKYERSKQPHVAKQPYASIASASAHVPFPLCSRRTPSRSAPAHLSKHGAAAASPRNICDRERPAPSDADDSFVVIEPPRARTPPRATMDALANAPSSTEADDGRWVLRRFPRDDGADERSGSNRRRSSSSASRHAVEMVRIAREFTRRGVR